MFYVGLLVVVFPLSLTACVSMYDSPDERRTVDQAQAYAAASESVAGVEREVREALLAEQRAFAAGDRKTLQAFFSDDPLPFVVNGCTIGDTEALPPCGSMAANRGKRPRRSTERHDV